MERKELILEGLDCASCAAKIERNIGKMEGVTSCNLNFATGKMTMEIEQDKSDLLDLVTARIKELEPEVEVSEEKKTQQSDSKKEVYLHLGRIVLGALLTVISQFGNFPAQLSFVIFLIAYLIAGGDVVYKAARNILKGRIFDENFLMTIATIGALFIGEYPEAVAVMIFYQVGEFFQELAVKRSRKSISELLDIRPDYANVKVGEELAKVSPEALKVGDVIVVKAGEKIALDGIVQNGNSSVDTSALTGEALPRNVQKGSEVYGGFINKNGLLEVQVTKEFGQSTVAKILDLVENASAKKAATETFISKFARYYTPVVVFAAAALAILPPLLIEGAVFSDWLARALIFLVISCPCALVVSIPLGFFGGIGASSKQGILVKGGNFLEALNHVEYAVFDKTGTLTKGNFEVSEISSTTTKEEVMEYAAYAEHYSNHPIALSISKNYKEPIDESRISNHEEIQGHGIRIVLDNNKEILVGNGKLLDAQSIACPQVESIGTIVFIAVNKKYLGHIIIADQMKEDAKGTLSQLKKLGVKKTIMLTGDHKKVGQYVGNQLGVDEVYSDLLPQDKVAQLEKIMQNKSEKGKVLFVGDGINDAPVLTQADIGVAMGGLGSDAAIEAADVVIMTDEPSKLINAIATAQKTRKIVWQNIALSLGVKAVFLVLGVIGIATMWEAVITDVGVTVIAVINTMRILKVNSSL